MRLDYTQITAPFDGRIGRSLFDVGNLVTAEKTVLATLSLDRADVRLFRR